MTSSKHNFNAVKHTLNTLCRVTKTFTQPKSYMEALPIMNQSIVSNKSWISLIPPFSTF